MSVEEYRQQRSDRSFPRKNRPQKHHAKAGLLAFGSSDDSLPSQSLEAI